MDSEIAIEILDDLERDITILRQTVERRFAPDAVIDKQFAELKFKFGIAIRSIKSLKE